MSRSGATATSACAGGSYVGQTQWFAAADAPKGLKAIVPVVSPPDAFYNEPICNGCFLLPMGEWMTWMGRRSFATAGPGIPFDEMQRLLRSNARFHAP